METHVAPQTEEERFHNPIVQNFRNTKKAQEFEWGYFPDRKKMQIFYRGWKLPETFLEKKAMTGGENENNQNNQNHISNHNIQVILHIHGMVSHSEAYIALADYLIGPNRIMYGIDLQGHGHSEGLRGDYADFELFLENIEDALKFLHQKYPNARFILSGESMGGLATVLYLATKNYEYENNNGVPLITKSLLWAPALGLAAGDITWKDFIMGVGIGFRLLFCPHRISIPVIHQKTFRNPVALKFDCEDPINLAKYSAKYIWNIYKGMKRVHQVKNPPIEKRIQIPVCCIQGGNDQVVAKQKGLDLIEVLTKQQNSQIFTFLEVPEAWHNIFTDPAFTKEYSQKITQFLEFN
jgi:alpha-beta hydrolase superfamily lysophospholipase